jgi:predicted CXXCH cytochrome family protein
MKKVLVLAAAAMLFATPALALIAGGPHDLSSNVVGGGVTSDTTETCVFCHTPHGSSGTIAPLWNRTDAVVVAGDVYGNPAGTMVASPTTVTMQASDVPLCLSCHDGVSFSGNLTNPPNELLGSQPTEAGALAGNTNLGLLGNDHPVGFTYVPAAGILNAAPAGITFYGAGSDQMWCSSCHDVHGATSPLLVKPNTNSALCTSCHIK